jgi:O-antigen ligase
VVTGIVGVEQQVVGDVRLYDLGYAYNSVIRFTGGFMRSWSTFNQPFPFAFYLMVVVLVTGSVALGEPRRARSRLIAAAMPLLLAGMLVAVVRAAWIGLVAGALYLAITRYRRLLVGVPLVAGVAVLTIVLGAAGFFSPPSVDARYDRWQQIPGIIISAPLGRGIGTAGAAAARTETLAGGTPTFDPTRVTSDRLVFQPDNTYLKMLYELGVLGLGAFVLLLLSVLTSTRRAEAEPQRGAFASGVSAMVVAAGIASLAATFFEIFPLDYLFWLLVAVVTCSSPRRRAAVLRARLKAAA